MDGYKIPTGSDVLDTLLDGGFERDVITTIYGPAGTGKTNFALLSAVAIAKSGKKVIFVDTEGGFSADRLKQVDHEYQADAKNMIFFRPTTFREQRRAFELLKEAIDDKVGIIIIDTIAMLYRLELGGAGDVYDTNRELGKQISFLTEIARKKKIPILIINQVYSDFDNKNNVKLVGGDLLKYGSKCLIELQNLNNRKVAILRKHRSLAAERSVFFRITGKGVEVLEE